MSASPYAGFALAARVLNRTRDETAGKAFVTILEAFARIRVVGDQPVTLALCPSAFGDEIGPVLPVCHVSWDHASVSGDTRTYVSLQAELLMDGYREPHVLTPNEIDRLLTIWELPNDSRYPLLVTTAELGAYLLTHVGWWLGVIEA